MPWWKVDATKDINYDYENDLTSMKKQPAKIMRYFPIIPRLKRIFASEKTAVDIRWHDECQKKDGLLRHPADGLAWKDFDSRYPDFASDSRNVRLALATDGFNPFKTMSTSYSTWPVVLVIYNFPPWVCMKQSSFMLSMIIPGDKSPGNDIDIYFPPLIDELKKLWEGVEVYDASKNETFKLRGALTSMIHDFPAYANMSGWSTKGQYACPVCMDSTDGLWLKHSRKWSYMGHRRWLPSEHQFRMEETFFNGNEETRRAPFRLTGSDVVKQLDGVEIKFGKSTSQQRKRNRQRDDVTGEGPNRAKKWWKKKSIFFELPYWEHNMLRHNLDVMHMEKNVCDNIIDTLLGHSKKSKDNLKARLDLVEMGIRNQLHPQILRDGRQKIPPSCLTLSNDEKGVLLQILHDMKAPDGYSSNISRCINLKQRKMSGLKSHDCHVLLEDLLPVALRYCGIFDEVVAVITDLSNFFKIICSKILDLTELDKIQERVVITLCRMERIFLPSFFTIMVHLIVHLVEEVKIGGPVQYRWMYPFERYFVTLKSFVKNTARPEGSIAEGYIAKECLTFCSRYLGDVETVFNRPLRNPEPLPDTIKYLFSSGGYPIGASIHYELTETEMIQIQRYVLRHCDGVDRFKSEFVELEKKKRRRSIRLTEIEKDRLLNEEFPKWFKRKMMKCGDPSIDEHIFNLSIGPMIIAKKYNGFAINGIRFHTVNRERNRKTQSSGVVNNTEDSGVSYYGRITDIIEVNYHDSFKVVLFKCEWVDVHHNSAIKQDMGYTLVNFSRLIHKGDKVEDDPFVFSSQVQQVFYISDCRDTNWCTAIKVYPRDRYDMVEREATDIFNDQINHNLLLQHDTDVPRWLRTDIDAEVVEGR